MVEVSPVMGDRLGIPAWRLGYRTRNGVVDPDAESGCVVAQTGPSLTAETQ